MRKIIQTRDYNYEIQEALRLLLNVSNLPTLLIIETVEDND